jgi:hypothetical protein
MRARVYSVDTVLFHLVKVNPINPSILVVVAHGKVPSSGWSDPSLTPFIYIAPPSDGILDLDFSAEAPVPGTNAVPALLPITATLAMAVPAWVKGVRVHASSNVMKGTDGPALSQLDSGKELSGGDLNPWPWAAGSASK